LANSRGPGLVVFYRAEEPPGFDSRVDLGKQSRIYETSIQAKRMFILLGQEGTELFDFVLRR
jgi:hypothetical protein